MKTIQPVSIWIQGSSIEATLLKAHGTMLHFNNSADFYYQLLSSDFRVAAEGTLTMIGEEYASWEQDEFAWDWISSKLGLTITGDYIPVEEERRRGPIAQDTGV